jgi:hypothetical protein
MGGVGSGNWYASARRPPLKSAVAWMSAGSTGKGCWSRLPILVVLVASGAPDSLHRVCGARGASDGTGGSPISPQ